MISEKTKQRIIELWKQGKSIGQIAIETNKVIFIVHDVIVPYMEQLSQNEIDAIVKNNLLNRDKS